MNLFKNLNPIAFIVSFTIGILIVCVKQPPKRVVYKYPTPENAETTIYRDNDDKCFKYKYEDIAGTCPDATTQPLNI